MLANNTNGTRILKSRSMEGKEIIYREESYYLLGLCYSIQNELGSNLKEHPYGDALEILFQRDQKPYIREFEIKIPFAGSVIGGNRVDFLFEDKILVDLKAKSYITKEDYKQMIRYLEATDYKLGIIVNFHGDKVTYKRVINKKALQK